MKETGMAAKSELHLSRRERHIMDAVYARGEASVAEVRRAIADAPGYSAVRALMRILEEKGYLRHRAEGVKYVYAPTRSRKQVSRAAVRRLIGTFFDGSVADAVAALLEGGEARPSAEELDRLARLIDKARKEGR
jgi:BlaI family penicillinase repressor